MLKQLAIFLVHRPTKFTTATDEIETVIGLSVNNGATFSRSIGPYPGKLDMAEALALVLVDIKLDPLE